MAIVATAAVNNPNYKTWTVTSLDADLTVTIAHGFGSTPNVTFQGTVSAAAYPGWALTVTGTNIVLTKLNAAGSGGATPGTTVVGVLTGIRPHTISQ